MTKPQKDQKKISSKKKSDFPQEAVDLNDNREAILQEKEGQLLRAIADLQNVRRRSEEDRIRLPQVGAEKILLALLPTLDNLELALKNRPEEENDWIKGVDSIFAGLFSALVAEGLEKIENSGEKIDPKKHEVLAVDETAKKGEVGEILQSGYIFKGRVVRPAKIKGGV